MRAAILATLQADAALMAALPGGLYDALAVGLISQATTPDAFDPATRELLPCGLLRLPDERPAGPLPTSARLEATLYWYGPKTADGRAALEAARARARALLHRVRLAPTSGGAWELSHAGDVPDLEDDTLGAAHAISRFTVPLRKV